VIHSKFLTYKTKYMKKVFIAMALAAVFVSCDNAADNADRAKDSLDSIANAKKDVIDSTTEEKKEVIDSLAEKRDSLQDSKDTSGAKH
jgi:hypothetical protein